MNQSEGKSCRLQASPGKPTPCSTSVDAPQPFIGGQSWLRARRHGVNIFLVGIRLQWGEQKGDRWGPLKEPLLFSSPSLQTSHQAPAVLPPSLSPRASPDWNPHPAFVSKPDCPHPGTTLILPPPPPRHHPNWARSPQSTGPSSSGFLRCQSVASQLGFNVGGPFGAQRSPTHPPGHNHGDGLDEALESHQLIEAEHLAR